MGLIKKKKVFFIIPSLSPSGAELFFSRLASELNEEYNITLISLTQTKDEMQLPIDLRVIRYDAKRALTSIPSLFTTLVKEKPDVVFSTLIQVNMVVALLIPLFRKTIFYARETLIPSMQYNEGKEKKIPKIVSNYLYPLFEKVIFQSNFMKQDHLKYFNSQFKNTVINNYVPSKSLSPSVIETDRLKLFTIARLNSVKQIDHMLKALAQVKKKRKIELTIYGDGQESENLHKLCQDLNIENKVHFKGFYPNPINLCIDLDALIMTSRYEGFPNAMLESLSIGKPVISYNSPGGIAEILTTESLGILVEHNNIEELVKVLINFDQKKFDPKRIRSIALSKFEKSKIINRYRELIELA